MCKSIEEGSQYLRLLFARYSGVVLLRFFYLLFVSVWAVTASAFEVFSDECMHVLIVGVIEYGCDGY